MIPWSTFTGMSTDNLDDIETWFRTTADELRARYAALSERTHQARWVGRSADEFRSFLELELAAAIANLDTAFQRAADVIAAQVEQQRDASSAQTPVMADAGS